PLENVDRGTERVDRLTLVAGSAADLTCHQQGPRVLERHAEPFMQCQCGVERRDRGFGLTGARKPQTATPTSSGERPPPIEVSRSRLERVKERRCTLEVTQPDQRLDGVREVAQEPR